MAADTRLYKMGFEIGNHTGHHRNVTKLSPEEIKKEISYVETKCLALGIPKPVSFAYPGNRYDSISREVLKEMEYKYARAGSSKYYHPSKDNSLIIPSYTTSSSDKLKTRVTKALKNLKEGEYIVLTFHGVPDLIHKDYSTDPEFLRQILETIQKHHYQLKSMKDLNF